MLEKWIVRAILPGEVDWAIIGTVSELSQAKALAKKTAKELGKEEDVRIYHWCLFVGVGWRFIPANILYFRNGRFNKTARSRKQKGGPTPNRFVEDDSMALSIKQCA